MSVLVSYANLTHICHDTPIPYILIRHDEQIAALEQKYLDILAEIASFKHSCLVSAISQPHGQYPGDASVVAIICYIR